MKILNSIIAIVFCFFLVRLSIGQPDTLWIKTYGGSQDDCANSIQVTSDGGCIMAGYTMSFGKGMADAWLIKTDQSGDTIWTKTFGGSKNDYAHSVRETSDSGYIIAGHTMSFGSGIINAWLIKTNQTGDTLWTRTYGGPYHNPVYCVQECSDGGYILAGSTNSIGRLDAWLIKTDQSGNTLWTKTYGGKGYGTAHFVQQTQDGGFIVTGHTNIIDSDNFDVLLIKTDQSGDTLWTKTFGDSGFEGARSVQETVDGGYIIAGSTSSSGAGSSDAWLLKTDESGDTLWTKTYGGRGEDAAYSVMETFDGGCIIAGSNESIQFYNPFAWLIRTNQSGDTLWTKTYGKQYEINKAFCVDTTVAGKYVFAGVTGYPRDAIYMCLEPATGITGIMTTSLSLELFQNYPNPFNPSTTIKFQIPKSEFTTLKVYNTLGKEVSTLVNKKLNSGNHTYTFDGKNLASGIYYYQLVAGDFREVKKMVLMK